MKKLWIILSLLALSGMLCSAQAAREKFVCGDYVYAIGRAEGYEGTAVITEYIGSDAHVVIPSELDG